MLKVAVLTRRGSSREINQDRVVVNHTVVGSEHPTTALFSVEPPSLVAVLDGLGGHPAGDIASTLAAEVIASGSSQTNTEQDLIALVEDANRFLYRTMFAYSSLEGMGTTIAGVIVTTDTVIVFHVGDSRVYFHAGEQLLQATVDDWEAGYITQTLGGNDSFYPIRVHTTTELLAGGRILAATDGVFGHADSNMLAQAMVGPLETVPDQLLKVAVEAGNTDDFSVAVIEPATPSPLPDPASGW